MWAYTVNLNVIGMGKLMNERDQLEIDSAGRCQKSGEVVDLLLAIVAVVNFPRSFVVEFAVLH